MSPRFEKVDLALSDWAGILNEFPDRTVFQTPAWLAFIAKTQNAEPVFAVLKDGTRPLGYFSGLIVKMCGIRILGSPLPGWTTSYMAMNLLQDVPRSTALKALQQLAFEQLRCVHLEIMDRHLSFQDAEELGFEQRRFDGFEIDLTKSEDDLFKAMTSACRRCIRRAHDRGAVLEQACDMGFAEEYYEQLRDVFSKRSLVPPYGVERVRELIRCLLDSGNLLLVRARDPNGRCIATGIFPASHDTMYFWGGASRRDSLGYRPNEAIQWYAMQYWRRRGIRRYDMGGGGAYKKKYGGCEIAVPWVRKSKYAGLASLRCVTKHVFHWRQSCFGRAETLVRRWNGATNRTIKSLAKMGVLWNAR